jgi:hypothetical protein
VKVTVLARSFWGCCRIARALPGRSEETVIGAD